MAERYVRPTVAGWLTPTLLAPWISVYGAVTAIAALGIKRGLFGKFVGWALGMALGTVWAFIFCFVLVAVDLALLGIRVRTLPAGKRAWGTTILSSLAVLGVYAIVPPYKYLAYGPWAAVGAVLVPMVVVAIGVRAIGGQKPPR